MPSTASRALFGIYLVAVMLCRPVTASVYDRESSPKVLSLAFEKQQFPKAQIRNGLLKRQKTVSASIDNRIISYVNDRLAN